MEFTFVCHDCGTKFSVFRVGHGDSEYNGIACPVCMSEIMRVYYEKCCDDDNDDCCDGKEACCTSCDTHARFPTGFTDAIDKIRGRQKYSELDAQVEEERKRRKEEFQRIIKCMSDPAMEE